MPKYFWIFRRIFDTFPYVLQVVQIIVLKNDVHGIIQSLV